MAGKAGSGRRWKNDGFTKRRFSPTRRPALLLGDRDRQAAQFLSRNAKDAAGAHGADPAFADRAPDAFRMKTDFRACGGDGQSKHSFGNERPLFARSGAG